MSDLEQQNKGSSAVESNVKRRSFIKKVSAGVVITSLPAKSVWGACNASGISGGSRSTDTCVVPFLSNGRSPGSWKKFVESPGNANTQRNKVKAMFSMYEHASDSLLDLKVADLRRFIADIAPVKLDNGPPAVFLDVPRALMAGGDIANLASCYLNAVFGFYTLPLQFSDADELVEHLYGVMKYGSTSAGDFGSMLTSSFTSGSTNYAIPS